jgi:hypothetical protein
MRSVIDIIYYYQTSIRITFIIRCLSILFNEYEMQIQKKLNKKLTSSHNSGNLYETINRSQARSREPPLLDECK